MNISIFKLTLKEVCMLCHNICYTFFNNSIIAYIFLRIFSAVVKAKNKGCLKNKVGANFEFIAKY